MYRNFPRYAEELKPTLDAAITVQLTRILGEAGAKLPPWEALSGGKHLRGFLLCLIATTLGADLEEALPRAVSIELIHSATLLHDDFLDQHRERRSLPAVWTQLGARRAVLLGDVILSSALHDLGELGWQDGQIASRAIAEMCRGAFREPLSAAEFLEGVLAEGGGAYRKIIRLKTGVLFGAACQLGAVAAGADERLQQGWYRYGVKLGEAYQIADDQQDVEIALTTRSLTAVALAQLAPGLLHFREEGRQWLMDSLARGEVEWNAEAERQLRALAEAMAREKDCCLASAAAEVERSGAGRDILNWSRTVPGDVVGIFDATEPRASAP